MPPAVPGALPSVPMYSVVPVERLTLGELQHFLRNGPLAKPLCCFTLPSRCCNTGSVTGCFETWLLSCLMLRALAAEQPAPSVCALLAPQSSSLAHSSQALGSVM